MTLGRTDKGAIKIKTDDPLGLRAVNCACCNPCGLLPSNLTLNNQQLFIPTVWESFTTFYGEQCCHMYLSFGGFYTTWADIFYFPNGQNYPVFEMTGSYPCYTGYFKEVTTVPTFIAAKEDIGSQWIKTGSTDPRGTYTYYKGANTIPGYPCDDWPFMPGAGQFIITDA